MSNLMPGGGNGEALNPRQHYSLCVVHCEYADDERVEGEACPFGHADHECNCENLGDNLDLLVED